MSVRIRILIDGHVMLSMEPHQLMRVFTYSIGGPNCIPRPGPATLEVVRETFTVDIDDDGTERKTESRAIDRFSFEIPRPYPDE